MKLERHHIKSKNFRLNMNNLKIFRYGRASLFGILALNQLLCKTK